MAETDVFIAQAQPEKELLELVGSAEKQSEHPLAQAIVQGLKERGILLKETTEFEAIPGFGIKATVDEKEVLIGTRKLMNKYNVSVETALDRMQGLDITIHKKDVWISSKHLLLT